MGDEIYSNPIARDKELKGRQLGEMKLAYFQAFPAGFLQSVPPHPPHITPHASLHLRRYLCLVYRFSLI